MLQFCGRMQACTQPAAPRSCILQNLDIKCVHRGRAAQTCSLFQGRVRVFLFPHPVIRAAESDNDPCRPAEVRKIPENYAFKDGDTDERKRGKESIMIKLRRYGVAGVLSYGLLNTVYYLGMFLFAWFYISPVPSGLGYRAAAERFIKLFALVWAGSQVTKLPRAGCALALAPAIDRGLTWFTNRFKFQSRGEAFGMIVASCFGLALVVFVIITFLWA